MSRFRFNESSKDRSMKKINLVIVIVCCLSVSPDIFGSKVKKAPELPEEIKNLTSEQIFVPHPPILTIYPYKAKKDGIKAEVWVKYKMLQGKIDSGKVIFCSKDGYDLEKAAILSLKEHDFSMDTNAVKLENKWLYSKIIFAYGINDLPKGTLGNFVSKLSEVPIESECTGRITNMPELIFKVRPEYPKNARNEGIEAIVYVRVLVGVTGIPVDSKIEKSSDSVDAYGFNDVVLKAVRECKFKPMLCDGEPMKCWVTLPFEFMISRK